MEASERDQRIMEGECESEGCPGRRFWQRLDLRGEEVGTVHCPTCGQPGSITWIRPFDEVREEQWETATRELERVVIGAIDRDWIIRLVGRLIHV
jgi:hypothetical protein